MEKTTLLNIFENGANWLRADFHLHTKADKEFIYEEDPNFFVSKYIQQLKSEDIRIGVITNHNKFDISEFKELRKNAEREQIYLLPGIEFSIKDGAKGLHLLIVFHDEWIFNNENVNHIQKFIDAAFLGIAGFDNPPYNKNSKFDLNETYKTLNIFDKDYFFILAHVDESCGIFEEMKGRNLEEFIKSEGFSKKVFGLQKSRKKEYQERLSEILVPNHLALVEGTDSASNGINGIGKGNEIKGVTQKTFLKIGAFNLDALKFALRDTTNRLSSDYPEIQKPYLKSIRFNTRDPKWKDKKISFNAAMNNLIGIRGSGKSTILETVRYALDIPIGKNAKEQEYKENVVKHFLGSGGKMEIEIIDRFNKIYLAEKIYGESVSIYEILPDGTKELQHNLKINSIINNPLYYGQKDLSDIGGETSTEDLISKLLGDKLVGIQRQIEDHSSLIINSVAELRKIDKQLAQKEEIEAKKAGIEKDMKIFKELEIDKKLNKQIEFNKDSNRLDSLIEFENKVINSFKEVYSYHKDAFANYFVYDSKENVKLFERVFESFKKFQATFNQLPNSIDLLNKEKVTIEQIRDEFNGNYEQLKEEFSEIKRTINRPNIEADTYVKQSKDLDLQNAKLTEIKKLVERKKQQVTSLNGALTELKNLWHQEFKIIQEEIGKLNVDQQKLNPNEPTLKIEVEFKGGKNKFIEFLANVCRGSGLRENHYEQIVEYPDLIEVYKDFGIDGSKINTILSGGNNLANFKAKFLENINSFLTYRVPDKYTIYYKERPLGEHSLGQRASALIIFILTLKENNLIIIDQPEDDLDNQTIYSDVITELKKLKNQTQFLFATHNPNIPVLGDCEQVISCSYTADSIDTTIGSIDDVNIQNKIINIMEGGEEAFNQRKMIYELWNH
ncbi:MAG: histidinol-phosphatase [Bacteroidetes bacterium]|nr:histidinol-phosphatase [Bacteroidota bacterium]